MDDHACTSCGAQRKRGTDFCWQCFAPSRRAAAAQPVGAVTGPAASGGSTSPGTVAAGPLARPGGSTLTDALRGPAATGGTAVAASDTSATSRTSAAVKAGVILVAAVAGFFAWRFLFGGFSFPEEINGQPRLEGEAAENVTEFLSGLGSLAGAEMEVAVYGTATTPGYIMARMEFEDPATVDLVVQTAPGFGPLGRGGLACMPDTQGSTCNWLDGDTVLLILSGYFETPESIRPIAEDVRADLG